MTEENAGSNPEIVFGSNKIFEYMFDTSLPGSTMLEDSINS